MNAIIAEESALRGFLAGFPAGLGATTADLCFLLLALAGFVTAIETLPVLRATMVLFDGILVWIVGFPASIVAAGWTCSRRSSPE